MMITKFRNFVRGNFTDSVVVPLKVDEKRPIFAHKDMTVDEIYDKHKPPSATHNTWGILLGKDLICIDFDDEDKHAEYLQPHGRQPLMDITTTFRMMQVIHAKTR